MSDRPKDWDPFSEDELLNSESSGTEDANKFIDELLASKSTESQEDTGAWYDLHIGGGEDPFGLNATGTGEEPLFGEPPAQEDPVPEQPPVQAAGPDQTAPMSASRRDKRRREAPMPAAQQEEDLDARPIRRRRQRKYGCLGGLMYFVFVVGLSIVLASVGWLWASDLLAFGKEDVTADIVLPEEAFTEEKREVKDENGNVTGTETVRIADIDYVADQLKEAGLIRYKFLFKIFCSIADADEKLDPGTYQLSTNFDYYALIINMQEGAGARVIVKVTIPEGYTVKETFALLEENEVCDYDDLVECAANYEFDYDFLADVEYGSETRLEGYLFPDTYEFYAGEDPEDAIERFLDNFERKFTSAMQTEGQMMGYSMREILTVASLIEKEAGANAERATIASVIYNRLNSSAFPLLQIDATVQYILPERKEKLTNDDLAIDSPYNTYMYPGLPIGPIANPGLASIEAALSPESTSYYFYALNLEGTHEFFTNLSDFDAFVNSDQFGG